MVTTGLLFGIGDVMAQGLEPESTDVSSSTPNQEAGDAHKNAATGFDSLRTARAAIYGGIIFAPLAGEWFKYLLKVQVMKGAPRFNTIARVAMDQCGFAPWVGIPLYFSVMTWMECVMNHESNVFERIQSKLSSNYFDTLKSNWAVWPAVQLVNFTFVPVSMRLLVVNVVSIGWNCFLLMQMNGSSDGSVSD